MMYSSLPLWHSIIPSNLYPFPMMTFASLSYCTGDCKWFSNFIIPLYWLIGILLRGRALNTILLFGKERNSKLTLYFLCPDLWLTIFKASLVSFSGKWYLETKIWAIGMLFTNWLLSLLTPFRGNRYIWVVIYYIYYSIYTYI